MLFSSYQPFYEQIMCLLVKVIGLNNEIGLMFLVDQNQTLQNVIINIVTEHIQF